MKKLYCCQLDIVWEDKAANRAKVREWIRSVAPAPGSLVLLPEMFSTGFSMNVAAIAEERPSATESFLQNLAREFGLYILGGLVYSDADGMGTNEAVGFSPEGERVVRYCKIHPFTFGGEAKHYRGGKEIASFLWQDIRVTPFICYDLRFPEIFRWAAGRGTHLFAVIANWPAKRESHWLALLKARAIENQAYVAGVNRCGSDPKLDYSGRSLILDPQGAVLTEAGGREGGISAEIDLGKLLDWRSEFPVLEDMHWGLETEERPSAIRIR